MKWALVTGGAKRLGRAVAEDLAKAGWGVAIHYHASAAEAEALAASLPAAFAIGADLADPEAALGLVAAATARAQTPLAGLINSASQFEWDDWASLNPQSFSKHMQVNTLAPVLLSQAFAKQVREGERGAIVNFSDYKLAQPYPDHLSYTLSKYALAGATQMLARALAPRVRVNAVAPGYVLPGPDQDQADFARLHAQTPLARGTEPADVAAAVRFLLEAEAITGQTLLLDSGLHFRSQDRDFIFQ